MRAHPDPSVWLAGTELLKTAGPAPCWSSDALALGAEAALVAFEGCVAGKLDDPLPLSANGAALVTEAAKASGGARYVLNVTSNKASSAVILFKRAMELQALVTRATHQDGPGGQGAGHAMSRTVSAQPGSEDGRMPVRRTRTSDEEEAKAQGAAAGVDAPGAISTRMSPGALAPEGPRPTTSRGFGEPYDTVRAELWAVMATQECAPQLIQLSFNDAATWDALTRTGGPHACMRHSMGESEHELNAGLQEVQAKLAPVARRYKGLGVADLWSLAAVTAIEFMGGPLVPWRPGRQDFTAEQSAPDGRLPDPDGGATHLRQVFNRMGFSDGELVALLGMRTVGWFSTEDAGDQSWTNNPLHFDNSYFKTVLHVESTGEIGDGQGILTSDLQIVDDPLLCLHTQCYAADQAAFFEDFSAAFNKLQEAGMPRQAGQRNQLMNPEYNEIYTDLRAVIVREKAGPTVLKLTLGGAEVPLLTPLHERAKGVMSRADLEALAVVVALEVLGGPRVPWHTGRQRSVPLLFPRDAEMETVRASIRAIGLGDRDVVVLAGLAAIAYRGHGGGRVTNGYFVWLTSDSHEYCALPGAGAGSGPDGAGAEDEVLSPFDSALLSEAPLRTRCFLYAKSQLSFFRDLAKTLAKIHSFCCKSAPQESVEPGPGCAALAQGHDVRSEVQRLVASHDSARKCLCLGLSLAGVSVGDVEEVKSMLQPLTSKFPSISPASLHCLVAAVAAESLGARGVTPRSRTGSPAFAAVGPGSSASQLRAAFYQAGLTDRDLVAIAGLMLPGRPVDWQFFDELRKNKGIESLQPLEKALTTDPDFLRYVELFAADPSCWQQDFGRAVTKMLGDPGQPLLPPAQPYRYLKQLVRQLISEQDCAAALVLLGVPGAQTGVRADQARRLLAPLQERYSRRVTEAQLLSLAAATAVEVLGAVPIPWLPSNPGVTRGAKLEGARNVVELRKAGEEAGLGDRGLVVAVATLALEAVPVHSYFAQLLSGAGEGLLPLDLSVANDLCLRRHVEIYAADQGVFFEDLLVLLTQPDIGAGEVQVKPTTATAAPQATTDAVPRPPAAPCPDQQAKGRGRRGHRGITVNRGKVMEPFLAAYHTGKAAQNLRPSVYLPVLFPKTAPEKPIEEVPLILATLAREVGIPRLVDTPGVQDWVAKLSGTIQQSLKCFADIEVALESSQFLCGSRITIADFLAVQHLTTAQAVGENWSKAPSTKRYLERMRKHPSWALAFPSS
uniref:Peroxidase n=1 Tax=Oxyrrhis marina TaxID=2969 RepID=A0A7S4GQ23_OXYMA